MRVLIEADYGAMSRKAAEEVAVHMNSFRPSDNKMHFVLGLATGSTPIGLYKELVRMENNGEIDFSRIVTFNLDEYYQLAPDHEESYNHFMHEKLFNLLNTGPHEINIPDGLAKDPEKFCREYEERIKHYGGIDLQILGIGGDGHIAFNEPGSSLASRTRVKTLNRKTIIDNYNAFFKKNDYSLEEVPMLAITMGIGTIMESDKIYLLASGKKKADVIRDALEGPITTLITASKLQEHPNLTVILDEEAASSLEGKEDYKQVRRGEECLEELVSKNS